MEKKTEIEKIFDIFVTKIEESRSAVIIKDENFYSEEEVYWDFYKCPNCGEWRITRIFTFCPSCGAYIMWQLSAKHILKMDGE